MLAICYRLLAVSAASALSWLLYQFASICRHGTVLARQFRGPPARNKLMGMVNRSPLDNFTLCSPLDEPGVLTPPCLHPLLRPRRCVLTRWNSTVLSVAIHAQIRIYAGHVAEMTTPDMHRLMLQFARDYGANFRVRLGLRHIIVITEVNLLRQTPVLENP